MSAIAIRDKQYTVHPFTEPELIQFCEDVRAYTSDPSIAPKVLKFLNTVLPELATSDHIQGDRILLVIPELFLIANDLQEVLLNSPEYKAAIARMETMPQSSNIMEAIAAAKLNAVQAVVDKGNAIALSQPLEPVATGFFRSYANN